MISGPSLLHICHVFTGLFYVVDKIQSKEAPSADILDLERTDTHGYLTLRQSELGRRMQCQCSAMYSA